MLKKKTFPLLIFISLISNCTKDPNQIAANSNMHKQIYNTNKFIITSYYKHTKNVAINNKPIIVYIEGDGKAWDSKHRLSKNPTPPNPLTLKLAALDQNPNVIYIARPCQFTRLHLDLNCSSKYWSKARYSREVVDSINEVIEQFKNTVYGYSSNNTQGIHLVGYSGGAVIAGIIASERKDVKSLRTIAGNLDHDAVSKFHNTTKLNESLNLIDFSKKISHVPQIHYIGRFDQIIPTYVVKNFVASVNNKRQKDYQCAKYKIFDNLDHYHGWEKTWLQIFQDLPTCKF